VGVRFQPTKTWLKRHRHKPPECPIKDCVCVTDYFNDNHHGFCVGYYPHSGDLDNLMVCWVLWSNANNRLERQSGLLHPQEAMFLSGLLNFAAMTVWGMLPEYRAQLGSMMRKRTRAVKCSDDPDAIWDMEGALTRPEEKDAEEKSDGT
jgi:hypothetical protein